MAGEPRNLQRDIVERLRPGRALAEAVLGLPRSEAVDRVTAAGFRADIITPSTHAVSADLRFDRVRLHVDDAGVVRDARAG